MESPTLDELLQKVSWLSSVVKRNESGGFEPVRFENRRELMQLITGMENFQKGVITMHGSNNKYATLICKSTRDLIEERDKQSTGTTQAMTNQAPLNSFHHTHNTESYKLYLFNSTTNTYQLNVPTEVAEDKGYNRLSDDELRRLVELNQQTVLQDRREMVRI